MASPTCSSESQIGATRSAALHPEDSANCLGDLWRCASRNAIALGKNTIAPAFNSLAIEPVNAGINAINAASKISAWAINSAAGSKYVAPEIGRVSGINVDKAAPGSAAYYSQEICATAGSFLAYAVAGKVAGKALGRAGEVVALKLESNKLHISSTVRQLAHDTRLANVLGATAYAGLREPKGGESHLSNAASTFAGFATFEIGNTYCLNPASSRVGKFGQRFCIGLMGGWAQADAASLVQEHRLADRNETASSVMASGLLNALMPAGRHIVDSAETQIWRLRETIPLNKLELGVAKLDLPNFEVARIEPARIEPSQLGHSKFESAATRSEAARAEAAKSESAKPESITQESEKFEKKSPELIRLHPGLEAIVNGDFGSPSGREALAAYCRIESRRYEPPSAGRPSGTTPDELAVKAAVEGAIKSSKISWSEFHKVLSAIANRNVMFGWYALENLPIVSKLSAQYQLDGKNLIQLANATSIRRPESLNSMRKLFAEASSADKPKIIDFLKARCGLDKLRDPHNIMVQSHCDKWPAFEALYTEFELAEQARLTGS